MVSAKPANGAKWAVRLSTALCVLTLIVVGSPARAQEVAKADWVKAMKTALPTSFCADGMYFRSCFRIDAQECERVAASATRICLDEVSAQIPAKLKQANGVEWGTKVGSCAGQAFETALVKKRVDSPKCNDPSAWVGK